MPFPSYVPTRQVTLGGAQTLETSDPLVIKATIKASRSLVWDATGYRFESARVDVTSTEAGTELTMLVPRTDVAGWRDSRLNALIDISAPGAYTHAYTLDVQFYLAGALVSSDVIGPFTVPAGDGALDLDKVIPAGSTSGQAVSIPDSWSAAVSAAQQAANAAAQSAATAVSAVAGKQDAATLDEDMAEGFDAPDSALRGRVSAQTLDLVEDPGAVRDAIDQRIIKRAVVLSEPVNVIAEGCVGDGATDDTDAFAAAFEKFINTTNGSASSPARLVIPAGRRIRLPNGFAKTFTSNRVGGVIEGGGEIVTDATATHALKFEASGSTGWRQFAIKDLRLTNAGIWLKSATAAGGTIPQFDLDRLSVSGVKGNHGIFLDGVFECRIKSPNVTMGSDVTAYDAIYAAAVAPAVLSSVDIFAPNTRYGRRGISASGDTKIYGGTSLYAQVEGVYLVDALGALVDGYHVENCWQSEPSQVGQNSVPLGRAGVRMIGSGTVQNVYGVQGTDSYRMSHAVEAYGSPAVTVIGGSSLRLRSYLNARGSTTGIVNAIGIPSWTVEPTWAQSGGRFLATSSGSGTAPYNYAGALAGSVIADVSGGSTADAEARAALNALLARLRALGMVPSA